MDTEFHYWITGLVAKRAGFSEEESATIAYASEYVDENDISYYIKNRDGEVDFSNFISQTMNILKPKQELMRIYPLFHFVPGDPLADMAQRRDGKMHLLNTTPNNYMANELLDAAFKSSVDVRLYRIGIATHAYVDTWSHQNFVGWYDYFNNIGLDLKPDIGHADGEHHPDWVSHFWVDERLVVSEVSNRDRFIAAAEALFGKYCHYLKVERQVDNSRGWDALEGELLALMGPTYTGDKIRHEQARQNAYRECIGWLDDEFDERKWFDAAIRTDVKGIRDSVDGISVRLNFIRDEYRWHDDHDKEQCHWYRFQMAVKEHERLGLELLSPIFTKMGINLAAM
jgi:hypothetical protein